jgi:AsmA protein
MAAAVKWIVAGIGACVLLLVAVLAALPFLLNTRALQAYLASSAAHALGRGVRFASVSIAPLPLPSVKLTDLQVAEDPAFGPGPFLTVSEGRLGIRIRPLLSGRLELADLTVHGARVSLVEDARGRLNVASLGTPAAPGSTQPRGPARGAGSAAPSVVLSRVRVVDGALSYRALGGGRGFRLERVNLVASQDAPGQPVRVEGDAWGEPGNVRLAIRQASLAPAPSRSAGEAAIAAVLEIEAPDVGALGAAVLGSTTATGAKRGRLELSGTAAHPRAAGLVTLDRLTLGGSRPNCGAGARPLAIEAVRAPLRAGLAEVEAAPVEASVAGGTLSLRATLALAPARIARLTDIAIRKMELAPLMVDHLCQPYAVTGPLDLDGEARLDLADPVRTAAGSGRFKVGPGRVVGREVVDLVREVVGMGGVVAAVLRGDAGSDRSPLAFDSITGTYTILDGVARTEDLLYQAREVSVRAAGTYRLADQRVAMEVTLTEGSTRISGFVSGGPGSLRVVPTGARLQDTRDVRKLLDRLFR